MFLRSVKAQGGKGVQHEYVRLVEAYRDQGKNKQRVVCNLGRKDVLAALGITDLDPPTPPKEVARAM